MQHNEKTETIHKEMLILAQAFHKLCVDNNIQYSLHGGSLLGAVREKGFIPWDDDMDISMTRENFNMYRSVVEKGLPSELYDDRITARCPRLWMQREGKPIVFLDIFVYDYITSNKIGQKIKLWILSLLHAATKTKQTIQATRICKYRGWKYRLVYVVYIIGKIIPWKTKLKWSDAVSQWFPGDKSLIHRTGDQYHAMRIIHRADIMSEYVMVPFEDTELMITKDFDVELRASYGDNYMTPVLVDVNDNVAHDFVKSMFEEVKKHKA